MMMTPFVDYDLLIVWM